MLVCCVQPPPKTHDAHVDHAVDAGATIDARHDLSIDEAIARASTAYNVERAIVRAIAIRESNMRPDLVVERTDDWGLMQVHWYPGSPWLVGILSRKELLGVERNVMAGTHELRWWRSYCRSNCPGGHHWFAHYKWGVRVPDDDRYGPAVEMIYRRLGGTNTTYVKRRPE